MKIKTWKHPEAYDLLEIEGENWLFHTIFEWRQLWGRWNWIDFHPVLVHLMHDIIIPGYEFELIVLGLGFRFRINGDWNKTETGRALLNFNPDNMEQSKDECPMCDGTGEANTLKSKEDEI